MFKDLKPQHAAHWLQYAQRKRAQVEARGDYLGECEYGHLDCAPVWGGTCAAAVAARYGTATAQPPMQVLDFPG